MNASAPSVPSPCVKLCVLDAATQRCRGCLRDLDEIAAWGALDDDAKRAIWSRLDERRAAAAATRGGAAEVPR